MRCHERLLFFYSVSYFELKGMMNGGEQTERGMGHDEEDNLYLLGWDVRDLRQAESYRSIRQSGG